VKDVFKKGVDSLLQREREHKEDGESDMTPSFSVHPPIFPTWHGK